MPKEKNFLAFDLGAESGRGVLAQFDGERIKLSEVHRFLTGATVLPDGLHWDVLNFWNQIKQAMAKVARECGPALAGIGLDTWGVDSGLLDRTGALISNPYHYRDSRTDGILERAFERVPREEIFAHTGIQFIPFNSLYQLLVLVLNQAPVLEIAETFLTIPDLFNYWLTGRAACEFTNATTTQCYDPQKGAWAWPVLERMGIPTHLFPEVVQPGTVLGNLLPQVAQEVGLDSTPVIAPACHDTGSAVAAVPAEAPGFAWISSGTWSVMGAELTEPMISDKSLAYNFTNEGGVCGTVRFSRNIMGLWPVQECRRTWAREGQELSYGELTDMAAAAEPFVAVIDPDCADFLPPGDMPARIQEYCWRTGQRVPETKGAIVRGALEGLALKYRWVLERTEEMLGRRLEPLHIVGGGTQNRLLSQFTADATGRRVITGPIEATATGNVLMQAMALGLIGSLPEARQVVRNSFEVLSFEPREQAGWDQAYAKLLDLMDV
ncbi:MAG: rhamnulokinase [Anaerolineales bacterium]|nr:rhamnulokinase [Anaerolineales bacterium]